MRRLLIAAALLSTSLATPVLAQERRDAKDQDLKKAASATPDKSLAGDLTRKKNESAKKAPSLQYDQFRLGVEMQVASKRRSLIEQLEKIIQLSPDPAEAPRLHFQLAELYWEESKFFFFEANRKDDELIEAINRNDKAAQATARADKAKLLEDSKRFANKAQGEYRKIVVGYKDFERMDEVLFFLGTAMMEQDNDRDALTVLGRLISKYPKSKYLPDAHMAFGEYYFNNSKGRRDWLEKALTAYRKAADFPESQVYAFAIYKQGWCLFNLGQHRAAMDKFKAVVLFGELAGASAVEKDGGKSGKSTLIREARTDYVRAFARVGTATEGRDDFKSWVSDVEARYVMLKQLANLFYEDGKDRDAAVAYNMLIKDKPLSPEAPGFQGRIVDCVLRAGNKGMTVQQVRKLVKIMQDVEASGVIKEEKDKRALADAKELSERTISNLAVTWHNEAKKTRDDDTFDYANQVYADYLTLFPDNPKAYDLRFFWAELLNDNLFKFEKAAAQYTIVARQDIDRIENGVKDEKSGEVKKPGKPGKWFTNALYNAILAYDEVVKKEDDAEEAKKKGGKKEEADFTRKLEIAGTKKELIEACDRYIKYLPRGDKRVEIMFKAANLFYRHNHFDDAVLRFSEITTGYPEYKFEDGTRAAEISANLVLDSYNALADWEKVNEWARRFYANDKLAVGKFREELSKLIEESSFKLVNQMEARKEYAKAAEAYLKFVAEFPRSNIADKALYNASIDFHQAKLRERAVEVRNRIIKEYPRSEFVPRCIFANAETYESVGDFEEAASQFERYVWGFERAQAQKGKPAPRSRGRRGRRAPPPPQTKQPEQVWEEDKAQVGLYNAGVFREYLGQYKQALRNRERYLTLWPAEGKGLKDGEAMFLSIADLYEKMGAYTKALNHLEEYERKYLRDPSKVLTAEGRIVKIFEQKLRRARDVSRVNGRILKYYEELPGRTRRNLDIAAVEAVANAHYLRNEEEFRFYAGYKLRWGRLPSPEKEFKAALQEKAKRLKRVQDIYTDTVGFKAGAPAICALYKIGLAYANFADVLVNAPMPRGADQELQDAIREQLAEQAMAPKEKAAEAFQAAVQKSRELDIFNDCATRALRQLRDNYRPLQYPEMHEATAELASVQQPVQGAGVLLAIQEVPLLTVEEAKAVRAQADQLRSQAKDLAEGELPDTRGGGRTDPEPPPSRGTGPSDSASDEPEDLLE